MRLFYCLFLLILVPVLAAAQTAYRGSIPEELFRPRRGESPYYPSDLIIGELGRGSAPAGAFAFASSVGNGFLSGQMTNPALASINSDARESHLTALEIISPETFRIGGGRHEADGAVSFLVRFIGREQGITGELYIRQTSRQSESDDWTFEELLLDAPVDREMEVNEIMNRSDYNPYERFY